MRKALPLVLAVAACGGSKPPAPMPAPAPAAAPAPAPTPTEAEAPPAPTKPVTNSSLAAVGLDPDAIDKTADPCDDFYQYACGNWIKNTTIPADKPMAMRSFVDIEDKNLEYEHDVLEKARAAIANPAKGHAAAPDKLTEQLGTYYGSCMDEAAIEKQGLRPIKPILDTIKDVTNTKTLTRAIAILHSQGFDAVFQLGPVQDSHDATHVIAGIDQGGLGLPDRDYYLQDQYKPIRDGYQELVATLLTDAGESAAKAKTDAADVLALETGIAKVSLDKVARRDPKATYNKIDREGVEQAVPHLEWKTFWKLVGLKDVKDVTVTSKQFLTGVDALVASTKPAVWRAYLTAYLLRSAAPYLTKKIDGQRFAFYSKLTGQQVQPPRWKRCAAYTDGALGDSLGQLFVRDKFGGQSKQAAEAAVHAITDAMRANLQALPWMDAATKQKALGKLDKMAYQIGFPKHWKSYSFRIEPKTWAANAIAADKAETARQLAKIGKPLDRDDWQMTAPTVNAYYDPQLNGMVFPAGILQPPFYTVSASTPVNLGGMGVVVGHELTHGFDDQGAQYDADGNLADWWQPDTEKAFKERTQCVVDQYSQYEVSGGQKLNGANTVGENIADIGGVKLALTAYRALRASAPDTVVADGYTEDQQFFLAFGQAWCAKMRPDYEKLLATVDVHSPARWRVNGALSATPAFSQAFQCKAGTKMHPVKQCVVW